MTFEELSMLRINTACVVAQTLFVALGLFLAGIQLAKWRSEHIGVMQIDVISNIVDVSRDIMTAITRFRFKNSDLFSSAENIKQRITTDLRSIKDHVEALDHLITKLVLVSDERRVAPFRSHLKRYYDSILSLDDAHYNWTQNKASALDMILLNGHTQDVFGIELEEIHRGLCATAQEATTPKSWWHRTKAKVWTLPILP
jgi:hypothetical protein